MHITILSDILTQYYESWLVVHNLAVVPRLLANNLYDRDYLLTNELILKYTNGEKTYLFSFGTPSIYPKMSSQNLSLEEKERIVRTIVKENWFGAELLIFGLGYEKNWDFVEELIPFLSYKSLSELIRVASIENFSELTLCAIKEQSKRARVKFEL